MRTLTIRKAAACAVLPLALASLTACGGGTSSSSVAADPQESSTPTSSASVSTPGEGKTVDSAQFLDMVKAAAKKITTAKFHMKMDFSGQSIFADGALDMTGSTPAMQMSMDLTGMGTPTDLRLVDGAMYIGVPGQNGKFMKMDLNDPNGPLGGLGDTLGSIDPQAMMDQMSPDAFKKVTYVGTDTVGGQQLKHYTVDLDTSAIPMLKGLPSSATASMPKSMGYDLWLDDQGRMAQFKMLVKKFVSMTMSYSDFGTSVDITAPDPSQVQSMPAMPSATTNG
jgi:hypothetical protein